jgi:hypothetical protein
LTQIRGFISTQCQRFIEAWHEHCSSHRGPDTER